MHVENLTIFGFEGKSSLTDNVYLIIIAKFDLTANVFFTFDEQALVPGHMIWIITIKVPNMIFNCIKTIAIEKEIITFIFIVFGSLPKEMIFYVIIFSTKFIVSLG